jgi:hypothetical protein
MQWVSAHRWFVGIIGGAIVAAVVIVSVHAVSSGPPASFDRGSWTLGVNDAHYQLSHALAGKHFQSEQYEQWALCGSNVQQAMAAAETDGFPLPGNASSWFLGCVNYAERAWQAAH